MVVLERKVGWLLRYRKVFFPTSEAVLHIASSMGPSDVVRVFAGPAIGDMPNLIRSRSGLTTCVDLSVGPARIFEGMNRKSCRYEIHRAEALLGEVDIELNSPRAFGDFLTVYNSFARTKGPVPTLSKQQFHEYATHGDTFVLYYRKRALCCHLILRDPTTNVVRLLYAGSRRLDTTEDAALCGPLNRYLHWHEMKLYCEQGMRVYDFGGIRYARHPTAQFKLSFGGTIVTEHNHLFGGTPWAARLGGFLYERLFKAAAPAMDSQSNP